MAMTDRPPLSEPLRWQDTTLRTRRRHDGTGIFQRIDYLRLIEPVRGKSVSQVMRGLPGDMGLSRVISYGHEIGVEESRWMTVLLPVSGTVCCATPSRDLTATYGQALLLPPGRRRTRTIPAGNLPFRAIVMTLPAVRLPGPQDAMAVRLADLPDLSAAMDFLTAACASGPSAPHRVRQAVQAGRTLIEGALSHHLAPANSDRAPARSDRALRRAIGLLQERFAEEITIEEIARETGISPRQMQDLFRKRLGQSPHAYLTRLRLEDAHCQLLGQSPAPTVTEAALNAGFAHLGRFPALYRQRFGMLPSHMRLGGRPG
jgi:AraC-like DNA-binding protein